MPPMKHSFSESFDLLLRMESHHCLVHPEGAHLALESCHDQRGGDFSSEGSLTFVQESLQAFLRICGRWREQYDRAHTKRSSTDSSLFASTSGNYSAGLDE